MVPALYQAPSIPTESPLGGYAKYLLFVLPIALSNLLHPTLFLRRLTCIDHINALSYLWLFSVGFGQWELPAGVNVFIFLFPSLEGYFGLAQSFNNITAPPNAFSYTRFSPSVFQEPPPTPVPQGLGKARVQLVLAWVIVLFFLVPYIYIFINNLFEVTSPSNYSILSSVLFLVGTLTDAVAIQEPASMSILETKLSD